MPPTGCFLLRHQKVAKVVFFGLLLLVGLGARHEQVVLVLVLVVAAGLGPPEHGPQLFLLFDVGRRRLVGDPVFVHAKDLGAFLQQALPLVVLELHRLGRSRRRGLLGLPALLCSLQLLFCQRAEERGRKNAGARAGERARTRDG